MQEASPRRSFWSELKRRHVVRVAITYAVAGFVVIEAADILLPALNLAEWTVTLVVALTLLGFPIALGLAWAFDITPSGVVRSGPASPSATTAGSQVPDEGVRTTRDGVVTAEPAVSTTQGEQSADAVPGAGPAAATASGPEGGVQVSPSIAVLPFDDMSPDGDHEYFGDGIAEELINALTRLEGVRVAARTSSFAHKGQNRHIRDIGKDLEVATILEGSVRKAGTRLRLTAQLIQVDGGHHLWSEVYEREMEDVFAIQDEITRAVVEALRVELLGEPDAPLVTAPTDNLEAYELYLKGRHYWSRRYEYGLQTAIEFFEEASQKDPDFALPYTGIADTHAVLGLYAFVSPREARERASTALEKATALGPELPEVLYSRGLVGMIFGDPLDEVERGFARVLELDPSHGLARGWRGLTLLVQGHWEEALGEVREAAEGEPHSAYLQGLAGLAFLWTRDATGAIPFAERALKLEPDGVLGLYILAYSYSLVGRHDEAVSLIARVVEQTNRHHNFLSWQTSVLAPAGKLDEVESIRKELLAMYDPAEPTGIAFSVAAVYVSLADGDNAVKWMKKGLEEGFPARAHVPFAQYDAIRGHPEFAAIIETLGLPALWADPELSSYR